MDHRGHSSFVYILSVLPSNCEVYTESSSIKLSKGPSSLQINNLVCFLNQFEIGQGMESKDSILFHDNATKKHCKFLFFTSGAEKIFLKFTIILM